MESTPTYQQRIGMLLRAGVIVSSVLMTAGLVLAAFLPSEPTPEQSSTLKELIQSLATGNSGVSTPFLLMFAGLVVLMLMPFVRVSATFFAFFSKKDWRFVGIATIVFCILVGQLVYSLQ